MENFINWINRSLNTRKNPDIISVKTLMFIIGGFAFLLPPVLYFGHLLLSSHTTIHESISAYYYSCMRNVFVGVLFTIGFLLFAYKGYGKIDNILASIGGVAAIGVAVFPTATIENYNYGIGVCNECLGHFRHHYISAGVLFFILAIFCLFLFTRNSKNIYWRYSYEFWTYFISGILIILCMIGIFVYHSVDSVNEALEGAKTVFVLESLALFFFGISWGVKAMQVKSVSD